VAETKTFMIRKMPVTLHRALKIESAKLDVPMESIIIAALETYLKTKLKEAKK